MDLMVIKEKFENASLEERIDFIDNYDLKADVINRDYIIEAIVNLELTNNHWYNVLIIELATDLQVRNPMLINRYIISVNKKNHKLVKLMLMDFFTETYSFYEEKQLNKLFLSLNKLINNRYDRLIVRNQALLLLIMIFPDKEKGYKLKLKNNLKRTNNYRSHIRVFNFVHTFLLDLFPKQFIFELMSITKSFNYGKAVEDVLIDLKEEIGDKAD